MKKLLERIFVATTLSLVLVAGAVVPSSFAKQDHDKVTICHATDSVTNPYNQQSVDADSADGNTGNDHGNGDHSTHTGPVATSQSVAQALKDTHIAWGDIIPPHDNYAGLNWSTDGQAVYNNGCNYPTTPTATPTNTPTNVPTSTPTPTNVPSATPTCTPTDTQTPTDTPTPSQSPVSPTDTPTVTPTNPGNPGGPGDGKSDGRSDGRSDGASSGSSTGNGSVQAVLGASTMAGTGIFETELMNFFAIAGMMVLGAGFMSYAKEKKA